MNTRTAKLLAILLALSLGGCASFYSDDTDEDMDRMAKVQEADNVSTSGIGEQADFSGEDGEFINEANAQSGINTASADAAVAPYNNTYYFNFDDDKVKSDYVTSIKAQAAYLRKHPSATILLAGHTDARGSREYNVGLGERRARSVFSMLRMMGVPAKQIRIVSYGQERPAADGHTETVWRLNRRVNLNYETTA